MTEKEKEKIVEDFLKMSPEEFQLEKRMIALVGTQDEAEINEEWKQKIWKCPKCKFWFTIDWNHDNLVCCACACCTVHPFLHREVDCPCPKCNILTRYGKRSKQ